MSRPPRTGRTRRAGAAAAAVAAVVLTALLGLAAPAPAQDIAGQDTAAQDTAAQAIAVAPPAPPAPDPAALAALPDAPGALPGLRSRGACPAGVAPDTFTALTPAPDTVPGADARGVTVAVVDSGVARHPRLGGGVTDGGDFVAGRSATDDCDGHGTAVAGLVAAAPAADDGLVGVAPGARVLAVRADSAWSATADGASAGDEATLARAVRAATRPGVGVLTLAVAACRPAAGLVGTTDPALGALRAAVHDAAARGIVVVAAAGNAGPACPANDPAQARERVTTVPAPGWFDDDVLTVGALDDAGRPDPASLAGPWVDLAAPGTVPAALDARSAGLTADLTLPGSAPGPVTGTSFAAARVAGAAALLRARFPALTAEQVVARLVGTAAPVPGTGPGRDPLVGAGALDVDAALAGARPAPPPAPPAPSGGSVLPWVAAGTVVVVLAVAVLLLVRRRSAR
ncbi:S8 family serine peptidase [Actinomycetospora sp. TBRC 11914]|uniref:S8 family serine peptidase n=1 Tax=Actinomycetospora sp. TBRC 11914 TaxID=2729387 RepID=UPI00145D20AF|nr:S8 family serine peptidase [Actinomycetospora sp. TBRC 11914]NMO93438.1 S8 family serine peptidase [Actinomycetospora sp. TBRC 11914]